MPPPPPINLLAELKAKKGGNDDSNTKNAGLMAALKSRSAAAGPPTTSSMSASTPHHHKKKLTKHKTTTDTSFEFVEEMQSFLLFSEGQRHDDDSFSPRLKRPPTNSSSSVILRVPLAPCVYRMCDYTFAKQEAVELKRCLLKLGVLRSLERELATLNALLRERLKNNNDKSSPSLEEDELHKTRFMELISSCGVSQKVSELLLKECGSATESSETPSAAPQVEVEHLSEFLQEIDRLTPSLAAARHEIESKQTVSFFPGLGELFSPGSRVVSFPEGMEGSPLGCSCVQCWYSEEENKATGKIKQRFVLVLEFVVSVGDELVFVACTDVYPEFHDTTRSVPIKGLTHRKLLPENTDDAQLLARLQQRGEFYASVATKNHFLEYYSDSFFPIIGGGWKKTVRPLSKGGRVMVDVKRGIQEGHLPVRGSSSDGIGDTVKEAIKLFESSKRTGLAVPFRTALLPEFDNSLDKKKRSHDPIDGTMHARGDSDRQSLWMAWPVVTGFSFTARVWGKLLLSLPKAATPVLPESPVVSNLSPRSADMRKRPSERRMGVEIAALGGEGACGGCGYISFQCQAFDHLVLAEEKKELIRAVAGSNSSATLSSKFEDGEFDDDDDDDFEDVGVDVIANKGAASIFLLHGPPGCGKTLTAEAIAELLECPLYVVTAGDLGTTASELEQSLGAVLELCQTCKFLSELRSCARESCLDRLTYPLHHGTFTGDALVLIDEADVFLEKRSSNEIERNALVCVMLRLLEYYSGVLFLSSNRSAGSIGELSPASATVLASSRS